MQARLREGLRSFPMRAPSRSTYPASGRKLRAEDVRSLTEDTLVP